MAWCFSTRASVATVLHMYPCTSISHHINPYNCNVSVWNWSYTLTTYSGLWILMAWCFSPGASLATVLRMHPCISSCLWIKSIENMACHTGGHYWKHYPGTLSICKVTVTHLMIGYPYISSTGAPSSNGLHWPDKMIGYQDSSPSIGHRMTCHVSSTGIQNLQLKWLTWCRFQSQRGQF